MTALATAFVTIKPDTAGFGSQLSKGVNPSAHKAGQEAGKQLHAGFAGSLSGIASAVAGAFVVTKGISFFKDMISEATESQKVGAQTAAVLKSTGGAAKVSAKQIGDLSTAISNKVGIDDEAIQSGANLLLTFKNVRNEVGKGNDIFNQSVSVVTDMSAALGQDMKSSSIQLGKALNDPIKGITALSRVGVTFDEGQKAQIKTMVKHHNILGAQKIILRELNSEFKGSAAAQATPAEKAQVAWSNFKELLGTAVLPIIGKVATFLYKQVIPAMTKFVNGMQNGTGAGGKFARFLGQVRDVAEKVGSYFVKHLLPAIQSFGTFLVNNKPVVATFVSILGGFLIINEIVKAVAAFNLVLAANPLGLVVLALAAFTAGLVYAYNHSKTFRNIVNDAFHGVEWAASHMWNDVLKPYFRLMVSVWLGVAGAIVNGAAKAFGWVPGIGSKLKAAAAKFNDFKDSVNRSLSGVHDRKVTVTAAATFNATTANGRQTKSKLQAMGWGTAATGGAIYGPGSGTSDSIPTLLSNGEHVWTAQEVAKAGGHAAVESMRRGVLRRASGGPVFDVQARTSGLPAFDRSARHADAALGRYASGLGAAISKIIKAAQAAGGPAWHGSASGGVARWAGVIRRVLSELGGPGNAVAGIEHLISMESGGNPRAINLWDSNARAGHPSQGLMQTIPSTFAAYAGPYRGRGITDPLANIYAGVNYAHRNYGWGMLVGGGRRSSSGGYLGYDQGGLANGMGLMPKYTLKPERVLSPKQTQSFDRLVTLLERNGTGSSVPAVHVDTINTYDPEAAAAAIRREQMKVLALMRTP